MAIVMFDRSVNFEGVRFRPKEANHIPDSSLDAALAAGAWIVEGGEKVESVTPPVSLEEPVEEQKVEVAEDFAELTEEDLQKMKKVELESIAQEMGLEISGLVKEEIKNLIVKQI